jgi:hypothetical protein
MAKPRGRVNGAPPVTGKPGDKADKMPFCAHYPACLGRWLAVKCALLMGCRQHPRASRRREVSPINYASFAERVQQFQSPINYASFAERVQQFQGGQQERAIFA